MRRNLIRILSLLFFSFLLAVPASAATLPQCAPAGGTSEFVLVAEDNVIFEPQQLQAPPRIIQGNVLVTSPHPAGGTFNNTGKGFVKFGSNTNVQGAVIADVIILPDAGATIATCIANQIMGSALALSKGSCQNLPTPTPTAPAAPFTFNTYAMAHQSCVEPPLGTLLATPSTTPGSFSNLCGPSPVIAACAQTAADLILGAGTTTTLPNAEFPTQSCFGNLRLKMGAVLNLTGTGPYTFKDVHMVGGSKLNGPATVNVNGKFSTDPGALITDIDLNIAAVNSAEKVTIQKNSTLTNTTINAPFAKCHIWTGTFLTFNAGGCSELCCKILDVEPIRALCQPPDEVCVCPAGFKFQLPERHQSPDGERNFRPVSSKCSGAKLRALRTRRYRGIMRRRNSVEHCGGRLVRWPPAAAFPS